jgi:hypothetical protein
MFYMCNIYKMFFLFLVMLTGTVEAMRSQLCLNAIRMGLGCDFSTGDGLTVYDINSNRLDSTEQRFVEYYQLTSKRDFSLITDLIEMKELLTVDSATKMLSIPPNLNIAIEAIDINGTIHKIYLADGCRTSVCIDYRWYNTNEKFWKVFGKIIHIKRNNCFYPFKQINTFKAKSGRGCYFY